MLKTKAKNTLRCILLCTFATLAFELQSSTVSLPSAVIEPTETNQATVDLTDEEYDWIRINPTVTVVIDAEYTPYSFSEQNQFRGYSIDLVSLAVGNIGLNLEFISTEKKLNSNEDKQFIFPVEISAHSNKPHQAQTRPYIELPLTLITTNKNSPPILSELPNKRLAIRENEIAKSLIKQTYPGLSLYEVKNDEEAYRLILSGQADAYIESIVATDLGSANTSHIKQGLYRNMLKDKELNPELSMAVNDNNMVLLRILQKGLDNISHEDQLRLSNKWLNVSSATSDGPRAPFKGWLILTVVVLFMLLATVVTILILYFFRQNELEGFNSRQFRGPLFLSMLSIVVLVTVLITVTLIENKRQIRIATKNNLQTTLTNVAERLDSWAATRISRLKRLGQENKLTQLVKQLSETEHQLNSITSTLIRAQITRLLTNRRSEWVAGDIYLISIDGINILAPTGAQLGEHSVIYTQYRDLFKRVVYGRQAFIPFVRMDADLQHNDAFGTLLKAFFIVPIVDNHGQVIALLAQSETSNDQFAQILRHGSIGYSGESYAINKNRVLIRDSNNSNLSTKGALDLDRSFNFGLSVKDLPAENQTAVLQNIFSMSTYKLSQGRSRIHTDVLGYKNDQGIEVYGAWLWDFNLGMGLVSEIEKGEAILSHRWLSIGLISTSFALIVIFSFTIIFTLYIGDKIMAALRRSRDILEERVQERTEQLAESEIKYRTLFELSEDSILTVGSDHFIDCNLASLRMFGFENKKELLELHPVDLSPPLQPDGSESLSTAIRNFIKAKKAGSNLFEWTNRRKNGERFPTEILITHMLLGNNSFYQLTVRDISDRKNLEQEQKRLLATAEDANRAKSHFLANMSHEIRTPMNAIIGLSHLFIKTEMSELQRDYVQKIQNASHSLLALIDDILDFSKIEAGQLRVESIEFRLSDVLKNLTAISSSRISDRPIELIYDVKPGLPKRFVGDPYRIGQILTNLVANAIKFTEKGNITVRIDETFIGGRYHLIFEVCDTGIGISSDVLPSLFEAFRQADDSMSRRYGGTGLGLSICKQLTELMEGEIHAESEPGEGSCFSFRLPVKKVYKPEPDTDKIEHEEVQQQLSGLVLLVEDNEMNQLVIKEILGHMGLETLVCNNGLEAVEQVQIQAPDFILMDIQMHIMDGYEATREIRKIDGMGKIPIFAITANAMYGDESKSISSGMNGHINKPVDPAKLYKILRDWLPMATASEDAKHGDNNLDVKWGSNGQSKINITESNVVGLNTELGLKYVSGNQQLYGKLVSDFYFKYLDCEHKVLRLIEEENMKEARIFVHTLSGVSANLGASALSEATYYVDKALKKEETPTNKMLEKFASAARELFSSLDSYYKKIE